jgi:DNA repair protein RecN (Recombination protein N)
MLSRLFIQNYAIIEELSISFHPHFVIITGETGAGKSILIGALGLVLGQRADLNVLRDNTTKCIVEATFRSEISKQIKQFFLEEELDADETIIIRREIAPNGKSRSFINDTPVTLAQLRELTSMLVDLHQQFDTLEIGDDAFQREVVDALAAHAGKLQEYQSAYKDYTAVLRSLQQLKEQQTNVGKELDYYRYLFNELDEVGLQENELENIEEELQILNNAETIKSVLTASTFALKESDEPVVQQLKSLIQQLQTLKVAHAEVNTLVSRLQSVQIELSDIADELETTNDKINLNPKRLQELNDRLNIGYKLLKKHNVLTTAELLNIHTELASKLKQVLNIDEEIAEKELQVVQLKKTAQTLADTISANRKKVIPGFEQKVASLLKQVGMPNALIKVKITDTGLQADGQDTIEYLFDANRSGRFEPLRKVASGGELSRLMLSIKSIVAGSIQLPTLIFDEIDTGISGEAARQVGIIMKDLARRHQVISITHQPQIAARADAHFFVYKHEKKNSIQTGVRELSRDERIAAIANMLAGDNPSGTVLQNAREMLNV